MSNKDFTDGSAIKNMPAVQETGSDPWFRKIPWGRAWHPL